MIIKKTNNQIEKSFPGYFYSHSWAGWRCFVCCFNFKRSVSFVCFDRNDWLGENFCVWKNLSFALFHLNKNVSFFSTCNSNKRFRSYLLMLSAWRVFLDTCLPCWPSAPLQNCRLRVDWQDFKTPVVIHLALTLSLISWLSNLFSKLQTQSTDSVSKHFLITVL